MGVQARKAPLNILSGHPDGTGPRGLLPLSIPVATHRNTRSVFNCLCIVAAI